MLSLKTKPPMPIIVRSIAPLLLVIGLFVSSVPTTVAQQPDIIQEHWYHSYATLTIDVNSWADDYPKIVDLITIGNIF